MKLKFFYLLSNLLLVGFLHAEEPKDPSLEEPKKDLPAENLKDQSLLTCKMRQRKEENGGVVNGLKLGTLEIVSRPSQKEFPFELRYTILPEAGQELDLIDNDYFPMALMAFKASDLILKESEEANPELDAENMQKRQIRYFLDYLQVVGGLYSNVDVYGYHVFNDSKELGVNVVYFAQDMSILAVAGQYYGNFYSCLPADSDNSAASGHDASDSLPEIKIQWKKLNSELLAKKIKRFSVDRK